MGVSHQAAHAHQLPHLGHIPPGARVSHHPNGIQRIVLIKITTNGLNKPFIGFCPCINNLGVTFHLGDFPESITLFGLGDLILSLLQQDGLVVWHPQVIHRDRHSGLGGIAEAQIFEVIGHGSSGCSAVVFVGPAHQTPKLLLIDNSIAEGGGRPGRFQAGVQFRRGKRCRFSGLCGLRLTGGLAGRLGGTGHGRCRGGGEVENSWAEELLTHRAATASMIVRFITTRPVVVSK